MEMLKSELVGMLQSGRGAAAIDRVLSMVVTLERENDRLGWEVLRAKRYRFGRSTEKLAPEELQQLLLALDPEVTVRADDTDPAVPAPSEPEQTEDANAEDAESSAEESARKKKRKRVRSMKVADSVERNVTDVPVPEEERRCALCGREKKVFGYVDHERIRYVPAKIVVDVEHRAKAACEHCRKDVSVAPRQQAPAVVRKVDASLLAKLLAEKPVLGLPLDRQRRELERLGLSVPSNTLQSYWAYGTDLLEPVAVASMSTALGQFIVGADDTTLKTLDKGSKHGAFRGHIWCFVGTSGVVGSPESVAYGYTPSWEATEISEWFSAIDGFIQCDGYAGYSREVEDDEGELIVAVPPERRLGCGMHVRAKFHAALLAKDRRAAVPLKHLADLYQVETDCRSRDLDADARGEERRRRSLPSFNALYEWVDAIHPKLLPKTPLRRATTYAINQRDFFRRCFDDGRFEIDNGRVERRIRLFATARRGFHFTGSVRGGERLAIAFTLADGCLLCGINPEPYFEDVINKLESGWPLRRLSELVPARWALEHSGQNCAQ